MVNSQHISRKDNVVAGTLSRIEEIVQPVNLETLAKTQITNPEPKQLLDGETSLDLGNFALPGTNMELYCDFNGQNLRPYATKAMRKQIFESLHLLGTQLFVWPGIKKDCRERTQICRLSAIKDNAACIFITRLIPTSTRQIYVRA